MIRAIAVALVLAALVPVPAFADKEAQPRGVADVLLSRPRPIADFRLIGHDGAPFGAERLRGQWTYVFFGFTNCPDICPAVLQHLAMLRAEVARRRPGAPKPAALFVSVDPKRDTPKLLAEFVASFDKAFLGATGEEAQIRAFERKFNARHRVRAWSKPGQYDVMHSSEIYLVDPTGRHVATFWPPIDATIWADLYAAIVDRLSGAPAR